MMSVSGQGAAFKSILVIGSGNKKTPDAINVDVVSTTNPDIVHDLNIRPWPFPDNTFQECKAFDVIEHLHDVVATMEEIHRVSRPGAVVKVTVPHYSSPNAFTDPTHRHHFSWFSLHYFTGEHEFSFYTKCRFRSIQRQLIFHPGPINRVVFSLANRFPKQYEKRWAWIFPAWFLYFELEVIKPGASQSPTDSEPDHEAVPSAKNDPVNIV